MKIKDLLTKIALCIVSVTLLILASNLADYEQLQPLNISQQ